MSIDLRVTAVDWKQLRARVAHSFRAAGAPEAGAIGLVGICRAGPKHEYILAKLLWPSERDIKIADSFEFVFDASYIRRAHNEMRTAGLAGLAFFHTHPSADQQVGFSAYDDREEPLLVENLMEIDPATEVVSVVLGKNSQCGRIWERGGSKRPLDELIVVGDHLSYLSLRGRPPAAVPSPAAAFDRGRVLTDAGALARLARMRVAVIGASGTGSLMCELLARAGCQCLMVFDDDIVKAENLNRILYTTAEDAAKGTAKVEVVRRHVEGLGLGCSVEAINGTILSQDTLARVREADLVLGCVDCAYPRHLLCLMAYQYALPYVDVGSEIGADERGIVSLDARVSYVIPGRYCLQCDRLVTGRQLEFESLSYAERQRRIALGYCDDLLIEKPAVMDLNMRASSFGMILVRHLLQPFLLEPIPVAISENAVTYTTIPVAKPRSPATACPTCRLNPSACYGDNGPKLGLGKTDLDRITGSPIAAAS